MFNKKLYIEGLKQTFIFGIFLLVLSTVINCFNPLNQLINNHRYIDEYDYINHSFNNQDLENLIQDFGNDPLIEEILSKQFYDNLYEEKITIDSANTSMLVLMFLVPIVMIFAQFQFLNNRQACDFFHSVPVSRRSLVLNFSLSALTWIFLCMIIPMLFNSFIYSLMNNIVMNYEFLLPNILEKILISFLIYSSLLIGISISGQVITASVVSGLILFLPRFFITMIVYLVNVKLKYFNGIVTFTDIIGNYNNLLIKKFTSIADFAFNLNQSNNNIYTFYELEKLNYNTISYFYTLILAIILFFIGCYIFEKRESELVGKSTSNPLIQHIIRIGLVIPGLIFAIAIYIIFSTNFYSTNIFQIILPIGIFTVLTYFTFEIISTKSLQRLIKSVLVFPVVIVFAFGYYGIISLSTQNVISKSQIDMNEIKSVNLNFTSSNHLGYNGRYGAYADMYDSYTLKLISEYALTNGEIIQVISTAYNDFLNNIESIDYREFSTGEYITVTINTKSKSIEREIGFNNNVAEQIFDILLKDEYINNTILTQLPEKSSVISSKVTSLTSGRNNNETTKLITDVLYEEYNSLTLAQQLEVVFNSKANRFDYDDSFLFDWEATYNLYHEMTYIGKEGSYKEDGFFEYSNDYSEWQPATMSDYNSNDFPLVLALFDVDNNSKFIHLNDNLPKTKKLIIDMFIESNQTGYDLLDFFINNYNDDLFYEFNISSVDDYYNITTQLPIEYNYYASYNKVYLPSKELLDFLDNSIENLKLNDLDYDNLYIVTFKPFFKKVSNQNYREHLLKTTRILLPFTQEEFEDIILNMSDYLTFQEYNMY